MGEFDLNSILSSLSPEDINNLTQTAMSILGGQDKKQEEKKETPNISDSLSGLGMPDLSQLSALAPVLQAFNSKDERIEFINALKPLLSADKRKKADEAMKLVRLMSVLPLLKERGLM
jgi:hypothetical protein